MVLPVHQPVAVDGMTLTTRAPLTQEHKTAALKAGALGVALMHLGLAFGLISGGSLTVFLLFAGVLGGMSSNSETAGQSGSSAFLLWIVLILGVLTLSAGLLLSGFFLGRRVLSRANVSRPTATLWATIGVGVIPTGLVSTVLAGLCFFLLIPLNVQPDGLPPAIAIFVVTILLTAIATSAIDSLGCWWMTSTLRAPAHR